MKSNIYKIDNSIERIIDGRSTFFLDQKEFKEVTSRLKKNEYNVYYPYCDSEKVILYKKTIPSISLFKITSYEKLRHQDILGSILALNVSSDYLGDIIVDDNNYYFYIFDELSDFIKNNLIMIGNKKISLDKISLSLLENYKRRYLDCETIVSSLRIDNVLSKIIGTNRDEILTKIKNKEVLLNYEVLGKNSYLLKENDIFSVRKYGKYKYIGVSNCTKKGNYIIQYKKYI